MASKNRYSPRLAWFRAGIYFIACFAIAWWMGVPQTVFEQPLVSEIQLGDSTWWIATSVVTAHVLFAYLYFWPRGTVTHNRTGHPVATPLFGLLWGAAQGQLAVSLYFAVEMFGVGDAVTAGLVIVIYSTWSGLWQSRFWDVYVTPEHNIPEWNTRKVLVAHVPYLILSVMHLMTFRNVGLFIIWQIVALTSSAWAMRFPTPWDKRAEE